MTPVQCQQRTAAPAPSNAWNALPSEVRHVVTQGRFAGFSAAQRDALRTVYMALRAVGYRNAVREVTWVNLLYHQIDARVWPGLARRLERDARFCADRGFTNVYHRGRASFRQVVRPGTQGLHISIQPNDLATLHLDSVSPVLGRGESGSCRFGGGVGLEHWIRDLGGYRGPPPAPLTETRAPAT